MDGGFFIAGFSFHWYGLIMGVAVLAVLSVSQKIVGRLFPDGDIDSEDVERSFWWMVIFGLVGARGYHVVDYWAYYREHMVEIWQVWQGGLGIYGAIFGGVVGVGLFSATASTQRVIDERKNTLQLKGGLFVLIDYLNKIVAVLGFDKSQDRIRLHDLFREKMNRLFWGLLDVVGVGVLLGQAIGRMGNFVNKELYGLPSLLPWAVYIPTDKRMSGYEDIGYYHPLFWYEAIWNLVGFWGIWRLAYRRRLIPGKGNYFWLYLGWYALGRTLLEPLRIRSWEFWGVPVAMWVGVVIMGIVLLIYLLRKRDDEWSVLGH